MMIACRRAAGVLASTSVSTEALRASLPAASQRFYHKNVVDHYDHPRNVGSFDKSDIFVGTGLVGAPACGDVMKLQIKVDIKGNIVDSCFKTFGCGSAIASSSVATEWVKGRSIDDVLTIKNSDIAKHLSLPPVKLHCSMLAEDAIKAAVRDIKGVKHRICFGTWEALNQETQRFTVTACQASAQALFPAQAKRTAAAAPAEGTEPAPAPAEGNKPAPAPAEGNEPAPAPAEGTEPAAAPEKKKKEAAAAPAEGTEAFEGAVAS